MDLRHSSRCGRPLLVLGLGGYLSSAARRRAAGSSPAATSRAWGGCAGGGRCPFWARFYVCRGRYSLSIFALSAVQGSGPFSPDVVVDCSATAVLCFVGYSIVTGFLLFLAVEFGLIRAGYPRIAACFESFYAYPVLRRALRHTAAPQSTQRAAISQGALPVS